MDRKGRIIAINISSKKGEKKKNVGRGILVADLGLQGDAHAEQGPRQVSLLSQKCLEQVRQQRGVNIGYGDFAENITVEGIDFSLLKVGMRLKVGRDVLLEISQIGKSCDHPCHIFYAVGECGMQKEGVFARVVLGGEIKMSDDIEIVS
ncbi:MAG: MOSC domain-containing protein [Syntrophales bacterium]|nr:MOSC domain-containing protein [Syntrophales bacterium]